MRPSRTLTTALLATVVLLAGCDEQPLPQFSRGGADLLPVAFIDLDRVARELGRDEQMRDRVESAREEMSVELRQLAEDLRADFETERAKLGEELDAEERRQLTRLGAEAQQRVQQGQLAVQRRTQELQVQLARELKEEIRPVVAAVARERGVAAVIPVNFLLWAEAGTDITQAVIDRLRKEPPG